MADPSSCDHCGLPLGTSGRGQAAGPRFCCLGCRMAQALAGEGKGPLDFLEARLLFSAFLAMGVMTFSLVLYGESVYGAEKDTAMDAVRAIGRLALALFSLPVFLLLGIPLLRGAWLDLRAGAIRMDGLITIATLAAYALSVRNSFANEGEVYYETATMVLVLVTFGRRLEAASRVKGRDAATELARLLPERAHRIEAAATIDIDPKELRSGDLVRVLPGEAAPADLVVVTGESEVRAAHVTGEFRPAAASPGHELPAGALNGTGVLEARVLRPAEEGSLGRIRRLLDSPLGTSRFIRLADRLAGRLALVAIVVAIVGGLRAARLENLGAGIEVALSVLLVACPCALGLATPLAFRAMRAALARRGVLVRDSAALEAAAEVGHALLDKTGTVTESLGRLEPVAGSTDEGMARMAALVASSNHPLARAVRTDGRRPESLQVVPGAGVLGRLEGRDCRAGSPVWMDREGFVWDEGLSERRRELSASGATLVAYAEDGRVSGLAALEQSLKPGAVAAVADLRALGLGVEILSGDAPEAVRRIGEQLDLPARGGMKPEDKSARLAELHADGKKVLMVGDGLNDAPVLRSADVGVAVAEATAAARSQAGIEIMAEDLAGLPLLVRASRRLRRVALGNLGWTCVYNLGALGLAAMGKLHPLAAVSLMIISSLVVCARSYRLMDFGSEGQA